MTKLKWLDLMAGRIWSTIVNGVLRLISPTLHERYMDTQMAKNPEMRMIIDAMAIVGRVAIEFGLQNSPTLKSVSTVVRGDLNAIEHYDVAEKILTAKFPGRAFISAVVLNGEWDRRCKYNIADENKRKLLDVPVVYFTIS